MIVSIWRYRVAQGREAEFERIYGRDGEWAKLFARTEGYLGTELLRGDGDYLTLDRWRDRACWDAFMRALREEYIALDAACEALTEHEEAVGIFEGRDDADRPA